MRHKLPCEFFFNYVKSGGGGEPLSREMVGYLLGEGTTGLSLDREPCRAVKVLGK